MITWRDLWHRMVHGRPAHRPRHAGSSARAVDDAGRRLYATGERWPEVNRVADVARSTRRENHFGESMMRLFGQSR